ncbi:MAG: phage Gp37/Gp68 family protein [Chloroflexota bacterium]
MGQNSSIEWTDHTFNPWWGCTKVSPGCKHCYAESLSSRYGHDVWGPHKARRTFGEKHWQEPLKWHRTAVEQKRRIRVFCASMADVFEDNGSIKGERERLWRLIEETPMLDWLLLSKRPENMSKFSPWKGTWPTNIWAMTSIETQEEAEKRIPELLKVPAALRALSVEPLLGSVDLSLWLSEIQWVIVGGESGPSARPMKPEWACEVRDQCKDAGVAFFFKQWGTWAPSEIGTSPQSSMVRMGKKSAGRLLDGQLWNQLPNPKNPMSLAQDR